MLKVNKLSKNFNGLSAIKDISFTLKEHEVLGIIGQNGAGKSTTFHSILSFIKYNGKILWNGKKISPIDYNNIGYLPEERSLFPKMTIENQIIYFGMLKGMKKNDVKEKIDKWLKLFEVKGSKKDKINTLSKGNKQKIQLICSLIHEPKLIILDEPFSGLDPINEEILLNAILQEKKRGAAIIFSSHNMKNVEKISDKIIMLNKGNEILNGTINSIKEKFGKIIVHFKTDKNIDNLDIFNSLKKINEFEYLGVLKSEEYSKKLFKIIYDGNYIEQFSNTYPSLDYIFKNMILGDNL